MFCRRFQWRETLIRTRYGVRNGEFDSPTAESEQCNMVFAVGRRRIGRRAIHVAVPTAHRYAVCLQAVYVWSGI